MGVVDDAAGEVEGSVDGGAPVAGESGQAVAGDDRKGPVGVQAHDDVVPCRAEDRVTLCVLGDASDVAEWSAERGLAVAGE